MTAATTRIGKSLPSGQVGLTYLVVLMAVAITGIWLAAVGTLWSTAAQREKEQALLDIGHAYREAIRRYYDQTPGSVPRYPESLDQLLLDKRYLGVRRYLRKLYPDPITGKDWDVISAPGGGIMGVRSSSSASPIKRSGFRKVDDEFSGAEHYSDWRFVYAPKSRPE